MEEYKQSIDQIEDIMAGRVENCRESGKWIVWDCCKSDQTMYKFVSRCKKAMSRPCFLRDRRFGILK